MLQNVNNKTYELLKNNSLKLKRIAFAAAFSVATLTIAGCTKNYDYSNNIEIKTELENTSLDTDTQEVIQRYSNALIAFKEDKNFTTRDELVSSMFELDSKSLEYVKEEWANENDYSDDISNLRIYYHFSNKDGEERIHMIKENYFHHNSEYAISNKTLKQIVSHEVSLENALKKVSEDSSNSNIKNAIEKANILADEIINYEKRKEEKRTK